MLIGRLTADPEQPRTIQSGSTVHNFRLVVGRSRKNPQTGQWENDPDPLYIDVVAWTGSDGKGCGKAVQYLTKGSQCYIEGELKLETWEDKNGGGKRSKHKLVAQKIELLGGKSDDAPRTGIDQLTSQHDNRSPYHEAEGDIPF
jgi:single-strand DNA-binding protein